MDLRPSRLPLILVFFAAFLSLGSTTTTREGRSAESQSAQPSAAARMRDAGVVLHAIGFGEEHDTAHLQALAGAPERYHVAKDEESLSETLGSLHAILPCVAADYWGRRCP